jgi:hypothetical protein
VTPHVETMMARHFPRFCQQSTGTAPNRHKLHQTLEKFGGDARFAGPAHVHCRFGDRGFDETVV